MRAEKFEQAFPNSSAGVGMEIDANLFNGQSLNIGKNCLQDIRFRLICKQGLRGISVEKRSIQAVFIICLDRGGGVAGLESDLILHDELPSAGGSYQFM